MKINCSRVVSLLILGSFVGLGVLPVVFAETYIDSKGNTVERDTGIVVKSDDAALKARMDKLDADNTARANGQPVQAATELAPSATTASKTVAIPADVQSGLNMMESGQKITTADGTTYQKGDNGTLLVKDADGKTLGTITDNGDGTATATKADGKGGAAASPAAAGAGAAGSPATASPSSPAGGGEVSVVVTEKIPGANCVPEGNGKGVTTRKYKCTIQGGFATVQALLAGLIKYATFLTALTGVLMIVLSGLQYATSAGDSDAQKKAVERITKLIQGLILLLLVALILNTIAPWIYG